MDVNVHRDTYLSYDIDRLGLDLGFCVHAQPRIPDLVVNNTQLRIKIKESYYIFVIASCVLLLGS